MMDQPVFEHIAISDLVLSALVVLGVLQLTWFSVMFLRRGMPPESIQYAIPPLLTIWVLMWPVYVDARWLWIGMAALMFPPVLSCLLTSPFWQQLRTAWSTQTIDPELRMYPVLPLPPMTHFLTALFITGVWFQHIPEFGFGLALCLCLVFRSVDLIDQLAVNKFSFLKLGFPAHPEQTLASHLVLIVMCTILLCWSLHVFHGTDWQALLIATLITALTASATRALVPGQWNAPAAMLSMGFVMWLL